MAPRKQQHSKIKRRSIRSNPNSSAPQNYDRDSAGVKLDLTTLLAETPVQSIDLDWENLPPTGRELQ